MEKILLKDIPRKCLRCDVYIFTEAPRLRIGRTAWFIAGGGVLATALWVWIFYNGFGEDRPPIFTGKIGSLLHGWPFFASALIAWQLPMEVHGKCFKCHDKKSYKIEMPKM